MENKSYLLYDRIFSHREEKETDFEELLPEYMPGIDRIVFAKAIPVVKYEKIEDGVLQVGVRSVYKVMFVSDYNKQLKCITFSGDSDFSFGIRKNTSDTDGENSDAQMKYIPDCNAVCTYISAKPAGARRIVIRSGIALNATVYTHVRERLPEFCKDGQGEIVCLEKSIPTVVMAEVEASEVRITRELALDEGMPPIAEIVDAGVQMCVCSITNDGIRATLSGNALFRALYRTEDDAYVTLVQDFPFTSDILSSAGQCEGEEAFKACVIPMSVTAESATDNYGENRVISLGITGTVKAVKYCTEQATLYEDAFCMDFDCNVSTKLYSAKKLAGVFEESFSLGGAINSGGREIERIIESNAVVSTVSTEAMENKAVVNFKLEISVLGVSPTGEIVFSGGNIPLTAAFTGELKASGGNVCFDTCVCVSSVECGVSAGEIKCNVGVCIRSIAVESLNIKGVADVEIDSEAPACRASNEFIVYYPAANETVWSVAKKYRVTPQALNAANKTHGNSFEKRTVVIPKQ